MSHMLWCSGGSAAGLITRKINPKHFSFGALNIPQAVMCEHAFCRGCINEWLTRQPTCPVDRNALTTANLRAVPRILRNLLSR